ncbi:pentapeptide repeat-containing protein [Glycomyces sp. NPDC048151]|uniref:pentapeptide repeat-containing protein n=1 Tax=Glycomyces sp. NPDC048151 TaxID=3364002 RepID=UPI0037106D6E
MAEIESLSTAGDAQADLEIAKMRLDTVRATLTVAAGIGAASALVLSFRRQQHDEFHSTQQRITELRMQAVEQLSSSDHTIRRGGLYNLERLGEQHEELRQLVLDEICSYLRRPFAPDGASSNDPEREVRAFAMEILGRRLKLKLGPRNYWRHTRLDLENAVLISPDFSECRLQNADFTGARILGYAFFQGTSFENRAWFDHVRFEGPAEFQRTKFYGAVDFEETVFSGSADFSRAMLLGPVSFERARFAEGIGWARTQCSQIRFTEVLVEGDANFEGAVFIFRTDFARSVFTGRADFELAKFAELALFTEAEFGDSANFTDADFDWVVFERATFRADAAFDQAVFRGLAVFRETVCTAGASFREAYFNDAVDFARSAFLGDVLLSGALFRKMLFDQSLPGNYRPVAPRGNRELRYWTVKELDLSEPSVPHLDPWAEP